MNGGLAAGKSIPFFQIYQFLRGIVSFFHPSGIGSDLQI